MELSDTKKYFKYLGYEKNSYKQYKRWDMAARWVIGLSCAGLFSTAVENAHEASQHVVDSTFTYSFGGMVVGLGVFGMSVLHENRLEKARVFIPEFEQSAMNMASYAYQLDPSETTPQQPIEDLE